MYTLTGLMITFVGFSALLLALRPAAGAKLSVLDKFPANTIMSHIFVLTAAALMPPLFALFDTPDQWIWRSSSVLFAIPMLALQVTFPHRRRKLVGKWPPRPVFAVFVVFGAVVTLAMLCYVLAGLKNSAGVYITSLTIDFFTVAFGFLNAQDVIMQQAMIGSDRPSQD